MHKHTRLITFLIILSSVLLLVIVAASSYYLGLQHQKVEVQVLQNERAVMIDQASKNSSRDRDDISKTLNDYNSACAEYVTLYTAYTTLYDKTGGAGQPRYTAPDSAKDNPDSCYH